jgi:hypothetical protein
MILYVNGDSHSAGAEAVNSYAFAEDDHLYRALGRQPHPDNLRVSYGCELANLMGAVLECDAESASSNARIVRTTYEHLVGVQGMFNGRKPDLVVIGWSTWEREEWWDPETKTYWQVNAGGIGHDWPDSIKLPYKDYIANIDFKQAMQQAQNKIFELHQDLQTKKINHLFFNCFEPLSGVGQCDWQGCYLEPYNPDFTYYNWLRARGFKTVNPDSYHFGPDAHYAWAEFLYQQLVLKNLTQ